MSLAYKQIPQQLPFPDWLRFEVDAEKVTRQLNGLKELTFYARNPNAYIRRIALLQLGRLCLKDAPALLTQVLEDALETTENKKIAAWALNRIIKQQGVSWFFNHPLLLDYTGNEDASIFGNVQLVSSDIDVRFLLTDHIDDMPDINDPTFLKTQMGEESLKIDFSLLTWLKESFGDILRHMTKSLILLLKMILTTWIPKAGRVLKNLVLSLICAINNINQNRPDKKKTSKNALQQTVSSKEPPAIIMPENFHMHQRYRPNSQYRQARLKREVKQMFQAVFYPLRLIKRHLLFTFVVLLSIYAFFSFTRYGSFFIHHLNPVVAEWNTRFVADTRADMINFFDINLTASADMEQASPAPKETVSIRLQTYQVTAPKGLNLRDTPRADGKKIVFMTPQTVVTSLGETIKDAQGQQWLRLTTQDGLTGWASARWLSIIEEGS